MGSLGRLPVEVIDLIDEDSSDEGIIAVADRKPKSNNRRNNNNRKAPPAAAAAAGGSSLDIINLDYNDYDDGNRKPAAKKKAAPSSRNNFHNVVVLNGEGVIVNDDGDLKPAAKKRRSNTDDDDDEVQIVETKTPPVASIAGKPKSSVTQVLEIFPDVETTHMKDLLKQHDNDPMVVAAILSERDYPKEKKTPMAAIATIRSTSGIVERKRKEPKFDYSSPNSFEPTHQYCEEVIDQLMYDFPFLKKPVIRLLFHNRHKKYTLTRRYIHDVIVGKFPRLDTLFNATAVAAAAAAATTSKSAASASKKPTDEEEKQHFQTLQYVLIAGKLSDAVRLRMGEENCYKKPKKKLGHGRPKIMDEILQDEIHHFEANLKQWYTTVENRMKREAARKFSIKKGTAIQCSCCFDDVAKEECVPCKEKGVSEKGDFDPIILWFAINDMPLTRYFSILLKF
jgi:hypothetical protein